MQREIVIVSAEVSVILLKQVLEALPPEGPDIALELRPGPSLFRAPDPLVLVAVISASGAVVGALIAGVLSVARQTKSRTVTLRGRTGRSIEMPADTPPSKVQEYVALAKDLDLDRIEF